MRRAYARWLLLAALATASATVAGCANDQETVNRVQPNALEKSALTGEWYTLGTIVDTQVDAPVAVGFPVGFDRIKWEIQEQYLIARRTYTAVRNVEDDSLIEDNQTSSVVAMYNIDSHFDIKREYNPATGEQTNVISENDVDRPWYQREFMRVDWSKNLLDEGKLPGGVEITPVALWDQDVGDAEKAELAPHFEHDADGNLTYFDLSNKFWAEPPTQDYDSDGDGKNDSKVAVCGFVMNMQMDCSPGAVTLRYSYARVEDHDYSPMEYTADRQTRFGYFLTKRDGWEPEYGISVGGRRAFVNRHNLWQTSHIKNDKGEFVTCTQDDVTKESNFEAGKSKSLSACMTADKSSRCDWNFARAYGTKQGACLVPYEKREIRPIVYYVTPNHPASLMPDAKRVGDEWNRAFVTTVASARRLECEANGGTGCSKYTPESTPRVFHVCSNPVAKGEPAACGAEGFSPRYGDVRYSFISWVSEPHSKFSGAPLGLGPSYADPVTGEIRSGVANLYGEGFESYASFARDTLAMMHGDLKPTDTQSNAVFGAWQETKKRQAIGDISDREADRHVIHLDGHDMAEANADMNFSWALSRLPTYQQPASLETIQATAATQWKAIGTMHENLRFGREGRAKLRSLQGSYIEDMLLDDEYNIQAGAMPGAALTDDEINRVSPLGYGGAFGVRGRIEAQKNLLRTNGQNLPCLVSANDFDDDGLLGLLQEIETAVTKGDGVVQWSGVKYKVGNKGEIDYDAVREMVKHPSYFGLTAHEVGHSLGLTHNFSGSYDALNYNEQFWKLRAADGKPIQSRAFDPMTEAESKGHIREFQYSTVMDYGNNFVVSDARGIGHYDMAAIKMGYGDLAEVFTKAPKANHDTISNVDAQASPFMVIQVDTRAGNNAIKALHYSQWPELVGGVENINQRMDVRYKDLTWRPFRLLFDGGGYSDYRTKDGKTYPVVPYLYCYDIFQGSRPACNVYDAGADPYEATQSIIDNYWDYYPFSHFQRGRLGWDPASVPNRSVQRYLQKLTEFAHTYALYRTFLEPYLGAEYFEQADGFGLYTLGVRATFDLLRQIISTPEPATSPGYEELVTGQSVVSADFQSQFPSSAIDGFNGRALRSQWDIGPSFEFINFTSSGWFKEKQLALELMLWADTGSLGRDTEPDVREYSSNFYTIFPDVMPDFMRALYSGDLIAYAPRRTTGGEIYYPTPSQILERGSKMKDEVLSPNVGFSLQVSAMLYGMALIPNTFDQDFINRSRVFMAGSSEAVELDPARTVSFVDQRSGVTYYAGSYPNANVKGMEGQELETGAGAAMINYAKALEARVAEATAKGEKTTADRWQAALYDFLDNMDVARYLGNQLGHGSNGQFTNN